jgi:nitrate reductase NapE component
VARIFITGMTSAQSSQSLNTKSLSFSGGLSHVLTSAGHEVKIGESSVFDTKNDFEKFDVILIGISPLLSVTSNKAYGALNATQVLKGDKRMKMFIDSPNQWRISANLKAVCKDTSQLVKDFYRLRKEYKSVVFNGEVYESICAGALFLANEKWPTVLYPAMPWSNDFDVAPTLPESSETSAVGIHVDSFYLDKRISKISSDKMNRWAIDVEKSKWAANVTNTLKYPHVRMKEHNRSDDTSVAETISKSIGSLISMNEDKSLWWSYRWVQSMNLNVPIASEWKITSSIGSSWSHLAAGIEEMSHIDRYELSISQREEYAASLPSQDTIINTTEKTLGI